MPETSKAVAAANPQEAMITNISKDWNRTEDEVRALMAVSFPTLRTPGQFVTAFSVAKSYDLDPFVKEIYAYVDSRGMVVIVGDAGLMKIARKQPGYRQIISAAVYKGDHIEIDFSDGTVSHKVTTEGFEARTGNPIGAYAILRMEDKPDVVKWVSWSQYAGTSGPWQKQKDAMICKCARMVACREAFGLSGLYVDAEMDHENKEQPDVSKIARQFTEPTPTVDAIIGDSDFAPNPNGVLAPTTKYHSENVPVSETATNPKPATKTAKRPAKEVLAEKNEAGISFVKSDPRYAQAFGETAPVEAEAPQPDAPEEVQAEPVEEAQQDATEEIATVADADDLFGDAPPATFESEEAEKEHYKGIIAEAREELGAAIEKWKNEPNEENTKARAEAKKVFDSYKELAIERGWWPAPADANV